jgi:hypothetical protein
MKNLYRSRIKANVHIKMMDSNLIKVNGCRSIVKIFEAADDLELVLNKAKPPLSCFEILRKIKKYYFVIKEFTLPRNELLCQLFGRHRKQWISHKMNIRHPGQLKKSKSWGPF